MVSRYSLEVLEHSQCRQDLLESECCRQMHSGRLFRLLAKLGFINERPEYGQTSHTPQASHPFLLHQVPDGSELV